MNGAELATPGLAMAELQPPVKLGTATEYVLLSTKELDTPNKRAANGIGMAGLASVVFGAGSPNQ
jgi:hypothetical protein